MSTTLTIPRPQADEHSAYYTKYVTKVPDGDFIQMLREQLMDTVTLLSTVTPDRENYAYAPDKWTIREVVGHLIDVERVMSYRALTFARGDTVSLPSFDENAWVPTAKFRERSLADLLEEFQVVRAATIHLVKHLDDEALARRGTASNNPVSVRALMYIIAGHERHHVMLFRERYGL